jgi:hypothetical protein
VPGLSDARTVHHRSRCWRRSSASLSFIGLGRRLF